MKIVLYAAVIVSGIMIGDGLYRVVSYAIETIQ